MNVIFSPYFSVTVAVFVLVSQSWSEGRCTSWTVSLRPFQIWYDTLTEIDLLIYHRPQFGTKLFELLLIVCFCCFIYLFIMNPPDLQILYLMLFKIYRPKTVQYISPLQLNFNFIFLNILYVHSGSFCGRFNINLLCSPNKEIQFKIIIWTNILIQLWDVLRSMVC